MINLPIIFSFIERLIICPVWKLLKNNQCDIQNLDISSLLSQKETAKYSEFENCLLMN